MLHFFFVNCLPNEILSSLNVSVKRRCRHNREIPGTVSVCCYRTLRFFTNYPKQSRGAIKPKSFPTTKLMKPIIVLKSEIIDIPPRMLAIMLQSPISCYQASLATQPLDCVGRDIYIIPFSFELSMTFPAFYM